MRRAKSRTRFNPFISLTDILFNLILVLIFVSAIFAEDINRQYAENTAFQNMLARIELERDALMQNIRSLTNRLDEAADLETSLRTENMSLEEQIAGLIANLDLAQLRQERLSDQITIILNELDDTLLERNLLQDRITVIIGELDEAQRANAVLEEEITLVLGNLYEADLIQAALRRQVSELSRNNFLVVELEWLTASHDLDLHVTDPAGNRFFWSQPAHPDTDSRLTLDNRLGARPNRPGLEIWTARDLMVGTYRIEVGLWGCGRATEIDRYSLCQTDGVATMLVRHRDGDDLITNVRVPANQIYAQVTGQTFSLNENLFDRLVLVAEVEVSESDGEVRVEVNPASGLDIERIASNP